MKNPILSCSLPGSSWCILSTRTRLSTQDRRPMYGTCTSNGVGTSSQLVTASGNNMKKNYQVEGQLAEQPFLHHLCNSIYYQSGKDTGFLVQIIHDVQLLLFDILMQYLASSSIQGRPLIPCSAELYTFIATDRSRTLVYKKISTYIYVYIFI